MSGAMLYLLCNESKAPELTAEVLEQLRADTQSAYDTVFAPVWGTLPIELRIGADKADDARVLHLVDAIPEAPEALAFHTVDDQGRPVLRLGVETIRSQGGSLVDEISKAASHEIFETACNPFVALFCLVPGKAAMLAYEACDPVQGGAFKHGATMISNFVTPAYFDAEDTEGPFDHLDELVEPLSCAADGYQAWSNGDQTFGSKIPERKRLDVIGYGRVVAAVRKAAA